MSTLTRPVRIHLAMKEGPLPKSIRMVLPIIGNESSHVYVEDVDGADLVIFTDVRDIEQTYNRKRTYAFLIMPGARKPALPDNCLIIDPLEILTGLIGAISGTRERLMPIARTKATMKETVAFRADAKRILVIDDTPEHIASAETGLAGHRLTTAVGYEDAMNVLAKEKFDVVLTDLHLPMSSQMMGDKFRLGELVPYGMLLMIEAARRGAKLVAVVTDLSHHEDPFSAAFDYYSRFSVKIEDAKVMMLHARLTVNGAKDWADALDRLTKE